MTFTPLPELAVAGYARTRPGSASGQTVDVYSFPSVRSERGTTATRLRWASGSGTSLASYACGIPTTRARCAGIGATDSSSTSPAYTGTCSTRSTDRREGHWPVEDAPHDDPVTGAHPIRTAFMRRRRATADGPPDAPPACRRRRAPAAAARRGAVRGRRHQQPGSSRAHPARLLGRRPASSRACWATCAPRRPPGARGTRTQSAAHRARPSTPYRVRRRVSDGTRCSPPSSSEDTTSKSSSRPAAPGSPPSTGSGQPVRPGPADIDATVKPATSDAWNQARSRTAAAMNLSGWGPGTSGPTSSYLERAIAYRFGWRRVLPRRLLATPTLI